MKTVIFHATSRKGNTYKATNIFINELQKLNNVSIKELFFPEALPAFCTGCTLCFVGKQKSCPNAKYASPIVEEIINADALIFATPHYGASSMPGAMKTLFDHIEFLILTVSPREEIFNKKAFIISTSANSNAAIKPIIKTLKRWGINRINSLSFRMLTNKWDKMPEAKQERYEKTLRRSARKFYYAKKKRPYFSTIVFYHASKFVIKKYIGAGNYPYELWKEKGYFNKRPF